MISTPPLVAPPGLLAVDALLAQALDTVPPRLADACSRILFAGGKRLRAGLVCLVAAAAGGDGNRDAVHGCAAAVELMHCATLVHDDLMDAAATRRGVPTINALEGTATAILAGDVLIGAASSMATRVSQQAGLILAAALQSLCAGQALEEGFRFDPDLTPSDALSIVAGKTGSLMQAACLLGAEIGRASGPLREACGDFGMAFGITLQLIDDALDLVSTEQLYGKPVAADFVAGTVTMPAITALQETPALRDLLRPGLTGVEQDRALRMLRGATGVASTMQQAHDYAARAHGRLARVGPRTTAVDALAAMPRQYCDRQLRENVAPAYRHLLGLG